MKDRNRTLLAIRRNNMFTKTLTGLAIALALLAITLSATAQQAEQLDKVSAPGHQPHRHHGGGA